MPQSALHIACLRGLPAVAQLLITKGADINMRDENGYTPLHIAAYHGKCDVAKMLLSLKANVLDQGQEGGDMYVGFVAIYAFDFLYDI